MTSFDTTNSQPRPLGRDPIKAIFYVDQDGHGRSATMLRFMPGDDGWEPVDGFTGIAVITALDYLEARLREGCDVTLEHHVC